MVKPLVKKMQLDPTE